MRVFLLAALCLLMGQAQAHQFQTLAVSIEEQPQDRVSVVLKTSLGRDDRPSNIAPRLEPACEPIGLARQQRLDDLLLRVWQLHCPGGLQGRVLKVNGLGPTAPDVVVSVRYLDGGSQTQVLDRREYWLVLGEDVAEATVTGLTAYLPIGVMHILSGPDHLLFVLCLMLVVAAMQFSWRRLLTTITAFTLAHSLTLAASALYGFTLPSTSVEAVIALSILLLAVELAKRYQHPLSTPGLSLRYPAAVAFGFGLLHGFGFAGALAQIGLPDEAAGWALLLFNVGVEAGQLLFVVATLALLWLLRRGLQNPSPALVSLLVNAIGAVSAYWFIDRLMPVLMV